MGCVLITTYSYATMRSGGVVSSPLRRLPSDALAMMRIAMRATTTIAPLTIREMMIGSIASARAGWATVASSTATSSTQIHLVKVTQSSLSRSGLGGGGWGPPGLFQLFSFKIKGGGRRRAGPSPLQALWMHPHDLASAPR